MTSKLLWKLLIHIYERYRYFFQYEWTRPHVVPMGGWVGDDEKGPSIFLKIGYSNKQEVLIPNLASKMSTAFGSKVTSKLNVKFKGQFPGRKSA